MTTKEDCKELKQCANKGNTKRDKSRNSLLEKKASDKTESFMKYTG